MDDLKLLVNFHVFGSVYCRNDWDICGTLKYIYENKYMTKSFEILHKLRLHTLKHTIFPCTE